MALGKARTARAQDEQERRGASGDVTSRVSVLSTETNDFFKKTLMKRYRIKNKFFREKAPRFKNMNGLGSNLR